MKEGRKIFTSHLCPRHETKEMQGKGEGRKEHKWPRGEEKKPKNSRKLGMAVRELSGFSETSQMAVIHMKGPVIYIQKKMVTRQISQDQHEPYLSAIMPG